MMCDDTDALIILYSHHPSQDNFSDPSGLLDFSRINNLRGRFNLYVATARSGDLATRFIRGGKLSGSVNTAVSAEKQEAT